MRVANNVFTNLSDDAIEIDTDETASVCTHIVGNSDGAAGSPGDFDLDQRGGTDATLQVTQASVAAIAAANNAANVIPGGTLTFNGTCTNPALPTNALRATGPSVAVGPEIAPSSEPPIGDATDDAAGNPVGIVADEPASESLTDAQLQGIVSAAIERWTATGLSADQVALLQSIQFQIVDLSDTHLGAAAGTLVQLDVNASGWNWFVDDSPLDDSEFSTVLSDTLLAADSGPAAGRMDLLTTVMHEMGHTLGLDDLNNPFTDGNSLMAAMLSPGVRRLPVDGQADGAVPHADGQHFEFIGSPIDIGTLPPGKSVTIVFDALIDDPWTGPINGGTMLGILSNQGEVSGTDFPPVLTDDPSVGGANDPTITDVLLPTNAPPVANADGPYTVTEGGSVTFDAGGSSDPDMDPLTYTWDINNDGTFGDATGVMPTLTWAQLNALGFTDGLNPPATPTTVTLRVSDGMSTVEDTSSLTVTNAPPTASISGPTMGVPGLPLSFMFSATDPSSVDASNPFTYDIDWDGDGTFDETAIGPAAGVMVSHAYPLLGTFPLTITATDKDGGVSVQAIHSVQIDPAGVIDGNLFAGGTSAGDRIVITPSSAPESFVVRINGDSYGPFLVPAPGRIIVFGEEGNDIITVATSRSDIRDAELHGGEGDDYLAGFLGDDLLVGGPGNDRLMGSEGMNQLFGDGNQIDTNGNLVEMPMDGADRLYGGNDSDILWGGGGNDQLTSGGGDDILNAGSGDDFLSGGYGDDLLRGGTGNDNLSGYHGNDVLLGEDGNDQLSGGNDDDILIGGIGVDYLRGGYQDDLIIGGTASNVPTNTSPASDAALMALLNDWSSAKDISGLGTLMGDGVQDQLMGDSGEDWFHASTQPDLLVEDRIRGFRPFENDQLLP
jgi:Ca2+-binding RTX toxin-like protein